MKFKIGDRVSWLPSKDELVIGTIMGINTVESAYYVAWDNYPVDNVYVYPGYKKHTLRLYTTPDNILKEIL